MTSKSQPLIAWVVLASTAAILGIALFLGGFWTGSARGGDKGQITVPNRVASWAYDPQTGNPTGPQGQVDFWNYNPETGKQVSNYSPGIAPERLATLAAAPGATEAGGAASGTRPGGTDIPFWPHETGVLVGTSETFVDMRADGSYYDPSLGRRVRRAIGSTATGPDDRPLYRGTSDALTPTSLSPDDRAFSRSRGDLEPRAVRVEAVTRSRGFDWEDGVIGGAFGMAFAALGMGAILIGHRRRSTLRTA